MLRSALHLAALGVRPTRVPSSSPRLPLILQNNLENTKYLQVARDYAKGKDKKKEKGGKGKPGKVEINEQQLRGDPQFRWPE